MKETPETVKVTGGDDAAIQQQITDLQLLRTIALRTASNRNRGQLLNETLAELRNFFAFPGGGIYLLANPDSPLQLIAVENIAPALTKELQKIPVGAGLIAEVIKTGKPHNWSDLFKEQQLYCKAILRSGWHSLLACPLISHERLVGIIFFYDSKPRQFSEREVELLGHCCLLLSAALDASELAERLEWQQRLTHAGQRELERSRQQLREHVARLEEANQALEQGNRMKDRFLALASHELRTPLSWIMLATEILEIQMENLPTETHALLETIHKGGTRLSRLVNDLLEMARIEARDVYLEQENIDLPGMLNELVRQHSEEALQRQLTLAIVSVPNHISPVGDQHHLRQALERILKNSLKFTPEGGCITMEASYITAAELRARQTQIEPFCPEFFSTTALRDHLDIAIIDTGIGIQDQERLPIFDKFHSAGDISLHGKQHNAVQGPSVGLGLPLAKGMIEAHGGMIWVEDPPGKKTGSCFHILLPLHAAKSSWS